MFKACFSMLINILDMDDIYTKCKVNAKKINDFDNRIV